MVFLYKAVTTMDINVTIEFFDELDNDDKTNAYLQFDGQRPRNPCPLSRKLAHEETDFVRAQDDSSGSFKFTYKAARFEEWWLLDSLGDFYEHQWISDVLRRVKGGKEASVYQCRAGTAIKGDLVAAKVYRPRSLRNLRNDRLYRQGRADLDDEGRQVINDGMLHAMKKKTEYGRELLHQSWIAYEFTSLEVLHAVGADVPQPYTMAHNAILMEFVGDLGASAPTLNEIDLGRQEAKDLFDRVLHNIELFLAQDRIHGDLSAYNILYWDGEISIIDFPQVISPKVNRQAFNIFSRDVTRICEYFGQQGVQVNAARLAEEMWTSQGFRIPVGE